MARKGVEPSDFFATSQPTESQRYKLTEVIGKGSYGVVSSAVDQFNHGTYTHAGSCMR
jgi:hypothetical protein